MVFFCRYGTWSLTGREEQAKNARKRGTEEHVRTEEEISGWRELHNEGKGSLFVLIWY